MLGLKNNAKLPEFLSDEVRPTLNMEPWYLRDQAVGASEAGVGIAVGGTGAVLFTVPTTEWWYIHTLWGQLETNIGGVVATAQVSGLRMSMVSPAPFARRFSDVLPDIPNVAAWGARFYCTAPSLHEVWAPPGSVLSLFGDYINVSDAGAASIITGRGGVRYTPVQV